MAAETEKFGRCGEDCATLMYVVEDGYVTSAETRYPGCCDRCHNIPDGLRHLPARPWGFMPGDVYVCKYCLTKEILDAEGYHSRLWEAKIQGDKLEQSFLRGELILAPGEGEEGRSVWVNTKTAMGRRTGE